MATIPLASPSLARSSNLPGSLGRAVRSSVAHLAASDEGRSPIWSCSVWGFACHRPYGRRGALLPHLFTLTRLRRFAATAGKLLFRGLPTEAAKQRRWAVCFLCHCPSGHPD